MVDYHKLLVQVLQYPAHNDGDLDALEIAHCEERRQSNVITCTLPIMTY